MDLRRLTLSLHAVHLHPYQHRAQLTHHAPHLLPRPLQRPPRSSLQLILPGLGLVLVLVLVLLVLVLALVLVPTLSLFLIRSLPVLPATLTRPAATPPCVPTYPAPRAQVTRPLQSHIGVHPKPHCTITNNSTLLHHYLPRTLP